MDMIWQGEKRGKLDYVTCWYVKAAEYIGNDSDVKCAFVSTNSICQGEQASSLWKKILFEKNKEIIFAVKSFVWDSEATNQARVHVVIVGFSNPTIEKKKILDGKKEKVVNNINGYLLDAQNIFIEEREKPICEVPAIVRGSQATDGGMYLFTTQEKDEFLKIEPGAEKFFRRFMMGREFINGVERWCLWMPEISPNDLKKYPNVLERVKAVREYRINSRNEQTRKAAETPWRFGQYRTPAKQYIAFAKVSSQRRKYVPFGFLTDEVVPGDKLFTIPGATLYHFGVLSSSIHMAWMKTVCGRMKSDYSYSTTIVYNNFVWCNPTNLQKGKIVKTAQEILNARALYSDSSLADLYDEVTMPLELRKAHRENDRAVMQAYGFDINEMTEENIVAELMKRYQKMVHSISR